MKPTSAETVSGVATKAYAGTTSGNSVKAWLDETDDLVIRAVVSGPGASPMTLVDVRKVSFTPPPASLFALPAACAGAKPPPAPAEVIAAETGDSGDHFVNANYGPGSKDTCTIVVRVAAARTMAPVTRR